MQQRKLTTTWISRQCLNFMSDEGNRTFPDETGGVLMGYWNEGAVVVTHIIGPGPKAVHKRHDFAPDHEYQLDMISDHYRNSGRFETYLGDWHTHPEETKCSLSYHDWATMRKIASHKEARASWPLMAILYGEADDWRISVAKYRKPLLRFIPRYSFCGVKTY